MEGTFYQSNTLFITQEIRVYSKVLLISSQICCTEKVNSELHYLSNYFDILFFPLKENYLLHEPYLQPVTLLFLLSPY